MNGIEELLLRIQPDSYSGRDVRRLQEIADQRRAVPILRQYVRNLYEPGELHIASYSRVAAEAGLDESIVESLLMNAGGGNRAITIGVFRERPSVLLQKARSGESLSDLEQTMTFPVWRLMAHHSDPGEADRYFAHLGRLAMGWGSVGDLRKIERSAAAVATAVALAYPHLRNGGQGGVCLRDFCHTMLRGDLVIISCAGRRRRVMEVTGRYEYRETPERDPIGDYQHQRDAIELELNPNMLWAEAGYRPAERYNRRWTLIRGAVEITGANLARLALQR